MEKLAQAIVALKNSTEVKYFFRDLLTEQELVEVTNRWYAARLLNKKVSYVNIEKLTHLSSATIARVSQWLKEGMGGYRLILKRLQK